MTTRFVPAPRYILDILHIRQDAAIAAASAPVMSAQEYSECKANNSQDSKDAGDPPECSFQPVLGVGQQAKVWGDQLEAGKAQQAVQVQERHAPAACETPQLPAEPGDVHHWLHLPHHIHQVTHAAHLQTPVRLMMMRVMCLWDLCNLYVGCCTEALTKTCKIPNRQRYASSKSAVLDSCAVHGFAMLSC